MNEQPAGTDLQPIRLPESGCDVWVVKLCPTPSDLDVAQDTLFSDELLAIGRIKSRQIRDWRLGARVLLRRILSAYTGTHAREIRFDYKPAGKPILKCPDIGLHFSVSHADETVVIAISETVIGVDVEKRAAADLARSTVSRSMTDTEKALAETKADPAGFYLWLWTMKEAVAKAVGKGLMLDFRSIEASDAIAALADGGAPVSLLAIEGRRWKIVPLKLAPEIVATLAAADSIDTLRYFFPRDYSSLGMVDKFEIPQTQVKLVC